MDPELAKKIARNYSQTLKDNFSILGIVRNSTNMSALSRKEQKRIPPAEFEDSIEDKTTGKKVKPIILIS